MPTTNSLNNQTTDASFDINRTTAGQAARCLINHTDGTNTASEACVITQTAPGGGDSYHLTMVNGTRSMCWGMDVSDNYALKETTFAGGTGSPSFGTTIRRLSIAGEQTLPLQPAFYAVLSAQDSNQTGAGATYQLGSGNAMTIVTQQGSGLATTGIFTAPVTGLYHFEATIYVLDITAAMTQADFYFIVNGTSFIYGVQINPGAARTAANTLMISWSKNLFLSATNTVRAACVLAAGAGNTADIAAGVIGAFTTTSFSGYLVC